MLLLICFVSGLITGTAGHWAGRKIYWYIKLQRYVNRRFSVLRYRRRLSRALRQRHYYPIRPVRAYSGYNSDYRLSKLFEKFDGRGND